MRVEFEETTRGWENNRSRQWLTDCLRRASEWGKTRGYETDEARVVEHISSQLLSL